MNSTVDVKADPNPKPTISLFKAIANAITNDETSYELKVGYVKETNSLSIQCYATRKSTGILLGSPRFGMKTPVKLAIKDLLERRAYWDGIKTVEIWIENKDRRDERLAEEIKVGKES